MKSSIWRYSWLLLGSFLALACQKEAPKQKPASTLHYQRIQGETMGTYYRVTYATAEKTDLQAAIDKELLHVNLAVSTWIDTSIISAFNQSKQSLPYRDYAETAFGEAVISQFFEDNLRLAAKINTESREAFDPTVMPLVNYWGFGYDGKKPITQLDSTRVDALKKLVGFQEHITLSDNGILSKTSAAVQLDLSASAKGYGVDRVAALLEQAGVGNYLVDIGGESRAKGINHQGNVWRIGINVPRPEAPLDDMEAVAQLNDLAVATSGNYRNYHEYNGVKYGHTISPFTGFPEKNRLLSASVFTQSCAEADGYATACMVLGPEAGMAMIETLDGVEALFLVGADDGRISQVTSSGMAGILE